MVDGAVGAAGAEVGEGYKIGEVARPTGEHATFTRPLLAAC
jgi:hypothetical protein